MTITITFFKNEFVNNYWLWYANDGYCSENVVGSFKRGNTRIIIRVDTPALKTQMIERINNRDDSLMNTIEYVYNKFMIGGRYA